MQSDKWKCKCGTLNSSRMRLCLSCGEREIDSPWFQLAKDIVTVHKNLAVRKGLGFTVDLTLDVECSADMVKTEKGWQMNDFQVFLDKQNITELICEHELLDLQNQYQEQWEQA